MVHSTDGLSSGPALRDDTRVQNARAFWAGVLECLGDAEEAHRGLLEGLHAEFQDAAGRRPIDLNRVDSITAQAAILLSGKRFF